MKHGHHGAAIPLPECQPFGVLRWTELMQSCAGLACAKMRDCVIAEAVIHQIAASDAAAKMIRPHAQEFIHDKLHAGLAAFVSPWIPLIINKRRP